MSALLFDMNLSRPELEREIDRMMREFDRIRKRVTGRHQVRECLPSVMTLPRESLLEQGRLDFLLADRTDRTLPATGGRFSDDGGTAGTSAGAPTLELVSERMGPVSGERNPSLLRPAPATGSSGINGGVPVREDILGAPGPPTVFFPTAPSLRLETLDIASLAEETLQEWVRQIQSGIVRGDLSVILEAVYWAAPQSSTPHAIRHDLVRTLYTSAMDTVEVCHLALRLALEANEPFEPIRRLSLDFLIRCFRVFGMYQSQVLETLRLAADPQSESRETVRLIAVRFLCQIMGNHPPVRQWLYQALWLRREPSLMCRMVLLEHILLWIQERDASERERFEGLYLLQRTLEDEQESFHVRFSIAGQMLDSRFAVFPPDVLSYLHRKIFPLCRQIVRDRGGVASGE